MLICRWYDFPSMSIDLLAFVLKGLIFRTLLWSTLYGTVRGDGHNKTKSKIRAPPSRILGEKGKIGGKKPYNNILKYAKTAALLRFRVVSKFEYKYGTPGGTRTYSRPIFVRTFASKNTARVFACGALFGTPGGTRTHGYGVGGHCFIQLNYGRIYYAEPISSA